MDLSERRRAELDRRYMEAQIQQTQKLESLGILAGGIIISGSVGADVTTLDRLMTTMTVGVAFAWVIGFLGIFYGIVALIAAFRGGGWGAGIMGVLAIVFGFIIMANPIKTALGLPFVIGIWLLIAGISLIFAAFRLRSA